MPNEFHCLVCWCFSYNDTKDKNSLFMAISFFIIFWEVAGVQSRSATKRQAIYLDQDLMLIFGKYSLSDVMFLMYPFVKG